MLNGVISNFKKKLKLPDDYEMDYLDFELFHEYQLMTQYDEFEVNGKYPLISTSIELSGSHLA